MGFTKNNTNRVRNRFNELKARGITAEIDRITFERDRFSTTLKCRLIGIPKDIKKHAYWVR